MKKEGNISKRFQRITLNYFKYIISIIFVIFIFPLILFIFHVVSIKYNQVWRTNHSIPIIIIPGGGVTNSGEVPKHTQLRIDKAIEIYRQLEKENPIIITLSAGTTHKPNPTDIRGFSITESNAAAKMLIKLGISEDKVFEENISLDTLGNVSKNDLF